MFAELEGSEERLFSSIKSAAVQVWGCSGTLQYLVID